jgi:hypothetical protein
MRALLTAAIVVVVSFSLSLVSVLAQSRAPSAQESPRLETTEAREPPPPTRFALPAADRFVLRGTIVERFEAGSYAYLRATTSDGDAWVVMPTFLAPTGSALACVVGARAMHFRSRITGRTFDVLHFGYPLETSEGETR